MPLSPHLQNLNLLPSPFIRNKIIEELDKISQLSLKLKEGYVEGSIIRLTDRHFTYLKQTCENRDVMVKRMTWILQYSIAVRIKLAMYLDLTIRKDVTLQTPLDCDFLDDADHVIQHLLSFYTQTYLTLDQHKELHQVLTRFRIASSYVVPDQSDHCYCTLKERLVEIRDHYRSMMMCRLSPPAYECTYRDICTFTREIETHLYPSSR